MACADDCRMRSRLVHVICHIVATCCLAVLADGNVRAETSAGRSSPDAQLFEDGKRMSDMLREAEALESSPVKVNDTWWRGWVGRHDQQLGMYDMIIGIEHLQDIGNPQRGWPMNFSGTEAVKRLTKNNDVKVAVIGMYNRGKTFILNKMAGRSLPDGLLTHTTGLSVMHGTRVAFVDTAGENMPVASREAFQDRLLTGQFLQMMAISISDVIVVVVNQLTLDDQRYLQHLAERLSQEASMSRGYKVRVIIVHNFRELKETADVLEMIQSDIILNCHAVKETMPLADGRELPYWKSKDGAFQHIVMAREGTEAGNTFNANAMGMLDVSIKGLLPTINGDRLRTSVLESFKKHMVTWLPSFFQRLRSSDIDTKYDLKFLKDTDNKHGYRIAMGPGFNATFKENLRVIEWNLDFGDDFRLEYEIITKQDHTLILVDIPGVLPKGVLPNASVVRKKFKQRYTWRDSNDSKLLEVNITLAGKNGPSVILFARREQPPDHAASRISGNRNYGSKQLPLMLAELYNSPESFHDSQVTVDNNGVLTIELSHTLDDDDEGRSEL